MNTVNLFYKTIGQGPSLVLMHGWGFDSDIWQPLLPELTQYFKVQLIDLPGFGRSQIPADYRNLDKIIDDIIEILPEKANYLGWSLGGLILFELAKKISSQIEKLVFVNSTPCFLEKKDWPGLSFNDFQFFLQELSINHQARWKRFICEHIKNRDFIKIFLKKGFPDYLTLSSAMHFLMQSDYRQYQQSLKIPQYYFLGGQDTRIPFSIAGKLKSHSNYSEIISLEDAEHTLFLSHKAVFIENLFKILK